MQVVGDLRLELGVKVALGMVWVGVGVGMRQVEAEVWGLQSMKGARVTSKIP